MLQILTGKVNRIVQRCSAFGLDEPADCFPFARALRPKLPRGDVVVERVDRRGVALIAFAEQRFQEFAERAHFQLPIFRRRSAGVDQYGDRKRLGGVAFEDCDFLRDVAIENVELVAFE